MRRLIIRTGAIGDCLVAFPAMEFLKADYTEVWVPTAIVPLVQFADAVHGIAGTGIERVGIDFEMAAVLRDRLASFDEIVSWYGAKRPAFRQEMIGVCPRCRFYPALPALDGGQHAVDFLAAQVGAPAGLQPRLKVDGATERETVVMHPFSGSAAKNWPLARFQQVARELNLSVEWTAGLEESLDGAHRFENLLELANWIGSARAYLGNDSGITHLAAATGVSTIALFGPSNPLVWAPRGERVQVLAAASMDDISVEAVRAMLN